MWSGDMDHNDGKLNHLFQSTRGCQKKHLKLGLVKDTQQAYVTADLTAGVESLKEISHDEND